MLALLLASTLGLVLSNDLPNGTLGIYCTVADDSVAGYGSDAQWQPELYPYQYHGANVVFLTFINPVKMPAVPPAMANLAKCKGQPGCPNATVPVIFSIGGYSYSLKQWPWLNSLDAAEAMAAKVANWSTLYGADGIDLDIESGPSGNSQPAANNLVAFAKKVRELNPKMYITQPVDGYPQVAAENTMVNQGFTASGGDNDLIDSVGIMDYSDLNSLNYVKDYADGTGQWDGFPIKVNVPKKKILAGIQGSASSGTINSMAQHIVSEKLGGFMVWFGSVMDKTNGGKNAFSYSAMDATRTMASNGDAWAAAIKTME